MKSDSFLPYSILEPAAIGHGATAPETLRNAIELAVQCEKLGYRRLWVTEHHNRSDVASCAPSVLIAAIAGRTHSIRVGSGGVKLANYLPLLIAEQFGTLESLFPSRIDLGVERGPGCDAETARSMNWRKEVPWAEFAPQINDLLAYFSGEVDGVKATPAVESSPELWIIGASIEAAREAARTGSRFAYSHHLSQPGLQEAVEVYRNSFIPQARLAEPYVMVIVMCIAQKTINEAHYVAIPALASLFSHMRGAPLGYPSYQEAESFAFSTNELARIEQFFAEDLVGDVITVRSRLRQLISSTNADEIMITSVVRDLPNRLNSYELMAALLA